MSIKSLQDKMREFVKAGLYLVTSSELSKGRSSLDIIKSFLEAGGRIVQLREKSLTKREYFFLAEKALRMCREFDAIFIVNDHLDVAAGVGADGVHLGQEDFPIEVARRLFPEMIIGASTHSVDEAIAAQSAGASYVNIGPLFPTSTKEWHKPFLGVEGLKQISAALKVPFTVMGGIKEEHIPELIAAGAKVIAVVTAITLAEDPFFATKRLIEIIQKEKMCYDK